MIICIFAGIIVIIHATGQMLIDLAQRSDKYKREVENWTKCEICIKSFFSLPIFWLVVCFFLIFFVSVCQIIQYLSNKHVTSSFS